ncbi:MAG TPA: immunoglobulin domain-containing protein, partial [Phycisphaerae bacterium]|nr:immunoglobulin domain-containing protein [Phycisphaerae bacterium]
TAIPMTYYSESTYPTWYRNWVDKAITWKYNRHMVVGPGIYMNTFAQSVTQMQYARNAGADGLCTYNYRDTTNDSSNPWDWYPYVAANLFTTTDTIPTMPWRSSATATEGTLWGRVTDAVTGNPIDDASVQVGSMSAVKSDGNGYYTVTLITAGGAGTTYLVSASKAGYPNSSRNVQVTAGEVRRADFNLGAGNNPPIITQHPTGAVAAPGSAVLFTVQAAGSDPLSYQWQKNTVNITNGGNISGATAPILQLSNVSSADTADYRCVVTNAYGNAPSNAASLTLATPPIVFIVESRSGGQNYANYSETGSWSNSTAKSTAAGCTTSIGSRFCTIGSSAGTAIFRFTPTVTAGYEVFTTNASTTNSGNPLVHKVTHAGGTTNVNACQNTSCSPNACNVWLSLGQYSLNAGTMYTVTLDGNTASGSAPSGNAGRSDAVKWQSVGGVGPQPPVITQHPTNQSVCPGGTVNFTVTATGDPPLTYQWQKNAANITNGGHYSGCTTSTLAVSSADGNDAANYRCVVTNGVGNATSNSASLTIKAATIITQHPVDRNVPAGSNVSFSAAATGDGTLTYQWQKNAVNITNGGRVSGATTATLLITSVASGDAGSYRCAVTAGCGGNTSNAATLAVSPAGQPGDFDGDTDVDVSDFGVLQNCLAISNPAGNPTCGPTDLSRDNIIDGQDVSLFVGCMSGSHIPAAPNCIGP